MLRYLLPENGRRHIKPALRCAVKPDRHQRKNERYDNGEAYADVVDEAFVAVRSEAERLEGAEKAMYQVPGEGEAAGYVNANHQQAGKVLRHLAEQVNLACAYRLRVTVWRPEITQV